MTEISKSVSICKIDEAEQCVYGWGIVCKKYDEISKTYDKFVDSEGDTFAEDGVVKALTEFMQGDRKCYDSHNNSKVIGKVVHAFPLTEQIAKAFEIDTPYTGVLLGMKPEPGVMQKYKDGTYNSFSVGGQINSTRTI